ncbi:hypothetical protein CUROG_06015 [Corynebacterium urogenitale]|uniref:Uncharacterized protein n=1 Tax=Corynebacterium urogenitale TaxID=2487892 RepID=A0A5J6Z6H2_9CORY|nr:hypothetical protein CUROG_06015 [Corynebacterium urogenitale]
MGLSEYNLGRIALAALYLVIQTGDEGAMLVWKEG